jgi:rubredoxin
MANPENVCSSCASLPRPSDGHLNTLEPYGEPVRNEGGSPRARWVEVTTSYKCPKCGARWDKLVESGATGHGGPFWTRIDPPPSK